MEMGYKWLEQETGPQRGGKEANFPGAGALTPPIEIVGFVAMEIHLKKSQRAQIHFALGPDFFSFSKNEEVVAAVVAKWPQKILYKF